MRFDDVKSIFYRDIPRRYHRFSRQLFDQILCVSLAIKSAYLFDLFPLSIDEMRQLLNHLSISAILLKYSINDLLIVNRSQLSTLIDPSKKISLIDLNTMNSSSTHPMLDQIRDHLRWIENQPADRIDFNDENDEDWSTLIQPLNHTTVFGYLLNYPVIYFYSSTRNLLDIHRLINYRLYVTIDDEEILLYSFSSPIDVEQIVHQWHSELVSRIQSIDQIVNHRLDKEIRQQSKSILFSLLHSNEESSSSLQNLPREPVYLNVYDLLSENRTIRCLFNACACRSFGVYHTSVQIYNVEYYYGHGICKCQPHSHVGRLILSKEVGRTLLTHEAIERMILFDLYQHFTQRDYDLLRHNCNHFTDAFLYRLLGIHLPMRYNRTERCLIATPCCTRTLNGMLGADWTRPVISNTEREKNKKINQ